MTEASTTNAEPPTYAYNDPDLSPKEFLLAVMRSTHLPLSLRIKAAEGAAPYFTPRPSESRHYECVDAHLTYIIGDNPALREACEPSTEAPEQDNGKSQSKDDFAPNNLRPQCGDPGPNSSTRGTGGLPDCHLSKWYGAFLRAACQLFGGCRVEGPRRVSNLCRSNYRQGRVFLNEWQTTIQRKHHCTSSEEAANDSNDKALAVFPVRRGLLCPIRSSSLPDLL
jgi:hypothetical protein